MARTFVRASSQYAEVSAAAITTGPAVCTFACWYKPSSIANGTALGIGDLQATSRYFALGMDGSGNAFFEPTGATATSASTMTNGVWAHIAGVQSSASSRVVYLNGTAGTPNTTTVTSAAETLEVTTVGGLMLNGSRLSFAGGDIAECAIWAIALTAADVTRLAAGQSPMNVGASPPVRFWRIFGDQSPEPDYYTADSLTVTGATAAAHPPVQPPGAPPLVMAPYR